VSTPVHHITPREIVSNEEAAQDPTPSGPLPSNPDPQSQAKRNEEIAKAVPVVHPEQTEEERLAERRQNHPPESPNR